MSEISLYGAISELKQIEDLFDDENLEIRKAELAQIIVSKTDAIVMYSQSVEDYLEAITKRQKEIAEIKKTINNKQDRFEQYLLSCLNMLGVKKVSGITSSISIRKPVKKVEVYDESLLDPRFFRIKKEVDLQAIKEALNNGEDVDGAKLIDGKESITTRVGK